MYGATSACESVTRRTIEGPWDFEFSGIYCLFTFGIATVTAVSLLVTAPVSAGATEAGP
jgi:hypothetical protein